MRGARSHFYIGRPVRVLSEGKWEGGVNFCEGTVYVFATGISMPPS